MFLRFIHLQYISVFHFFLWLNNILFYGYTTFCISIHMLMGICIVSTFWLLGICWCEHWCASFVWTPVFSSFGYIPRSRIAILIIFKRQLKRRNTYSILLSSIRKVWIFTLSIWSLLRDSFLDHLVHLCILIYCLFPPKNEDLERMDFILSPLSPVNVAQCLALFRRRYWANGWVSTLLWETGSHSGKQAPVLCWGDCKLVLLI